MSRFLGSAIAVVCVLILAAAVPCAFGKTEEDIVYVDDSATGTPDGTSWNRAFRTIQAGIDAAVAQGKTFVWVAGGVYKEKVELRSRIQLVGIPAGVVSATDPVIDGENVRQCVTREGDAGEGDASIYNFKITRGQGESGGGLYCTRGVMAVMSCQFVENHAAVAGGAAAVSGEGELNFNDCVFEGNTATERGGACYSGGTRSFICNSQFFGNRAESGGALSCDGSDDNICGNTIFFNNAALVGAAAEVQAESGLIMAQCTVFGNVGGPAITNYSPRFKAVNSIFWNRVVEEIVDSTEYADVTYCVVEGGFPGTGNLNLEPMLVYPEGYNFRLKADSPCINAGMDTSVLEYYFVSLDIDNHERNSDGLGFDIGAYEYVPDIDGDGDGLNDAEEIDIYGTDPDDPDTDGDGINDGLEVQFGLDPLRDDDSLDIDGDGLTAAQEIYYGTKPLRADTDRDGMPDGYEIRFGFNPLDPSDASEDADMDGLDNLEEFRRGSDPVDASSPNPTVVYVSPDGMNVPSGGTLAMPWATIAYALSRTASSIENPATVVLLDGTYHEDVQLKPGVILAGAGNAVIYGAVTGAMGSVVRGLELREASGISALLYVHDAAMVVTHVVFSGVAGGTASGIVATGAATGATLITDCRFQYLRHGIEVFGLIPRIRRCIFDEISGNGVIIHNHPEKQGEEQDPAALGDAKDLNSGWNFFRDIDGYAVVNERPELVLAQKSCWNTDDPDEIAARVMGNVDTGNPVPKSASLLPGTIFCTVWDDDTDAPVTNGSVTLTPGAFSPVTDNTAGVYTIACVPAGQFTVAVAASGYGTDSQSVSVEDGESCAVTFPMKKGAGGGGGCGTTASKDPEATKGMMVVVTAGILILFGRFRGRKPSVPVAGS